MTEKQKSDALKAFEKGNKDIVTAYNKKGIITYSVQTQTGECCLLKEPNARQSAALSLCIATSSEEDTVDRLINLVDDLWLNGDKKIKENEDFKIQVAMTLIRIGNINIAESKKN